MQVSLSNKLNVLCTKLHSVIDDSVIYTVNTDESFWRREYTYLRDTGPTLGLSSSNSGSGFGGRFSYFNTLGSGTNGAKGGAIVGMINWRKRTFEIQGVRKRIDDIRRKPRGVLGHFGGVK